ncbi:androgen-dependent TFPI-regulating protein isoform X3 [Camelus ferus]|uniref:Androgen-dependent TFPI-regulating protein isoform X3 n=2 Tax=Camelus TaxID=9836 RepID=A0A8B8RKC1_CAMFR|nr:androgen-dependent TFPI-regulating protein isoform X3 [Camelus dromedarius]XP_032318393.1 androgen-dependent TFPI-regulating protein isoform X3 [Camelus ferus]XP_045365557.1 androgen-dependent TFPI-regulating protein isoform X3 [Camelus bactrianus]
MTRTSTCIYHFLVFSWYVFLNFHISQQVGDPRKSKLFINGGQWKYLTFLNLFVFLSFWSLFLYDRELVYPKALDDIFPVWLNHALHTFILPFSLVEVILRPHCYPLKKKGLTLLTAAIVAYVSRVLWIYSETGTWVYPVFAKLSLMGLAAFFSLSYIFIVGIYLFGEKLNHWKWGDMMQLRNKRK